MSSSQGVSTYGRVPAPGLAIVTATAFAIGALLGVAVQGALDRTTVATTVASQRVAGVADHNMSDAANAAQHSGRPTFFKGVADHNMSDAARLATQSNADGADAS